MGEKKERKRIGSREHFLQAQEISGVVLISEGKDEGERRERRGLRGGKEGKEEDLAGMNPTRS